MLPRCQIELFGWDMFPFCFVCDTPEASFQPQFAPCVTFYLLWDHFWPMKVCLWIPPLLIRYGTETQSSVGGPSSSSDPSGLSACLESFCVVFSHSCTARRAALPSWSVYRTECCSHRQRLRNSMGYGVIHALNATWTLGASRLG